MKPRMSASRVLLLSVMLLTFIFVAPRVALPDSTIYSFTTIDPPSVFSTEAYGINNAGQIVGLFSDATGVHGFLRDTNGHFTTINVPGASDTGAQGLNDAGTIVGWFYDGTRYYGFLRNTNGHFTTINVPGAVNTYAFGINNAGKIVGVFYDGTSDHGFLRNTNGSFTTINVPGASFTHAYSINNAGQIVGLFTDTITHIGHGFVAAQILTLPFPIGETWYVCQGYNGPISHKKGAAALDLSSDPQSFAGPNGCGAGADASTGKPVLAPANGTVKKSFRDKGPVNDLLCLELDGIGAMKVGHLTNMLPDGAKFNRNDQLGIVASPSDGNGGYAHIHIQLDFSTHCEHAETIPFTAQYQFEDAPDMPYDDNGTPKNKKDDPQNQWRGIALTRSQ